MTNYSVGHQAEKVAKDYLLSTGYSIRDINWRTPYCEIDIIARKGEVVYFFEVKYRRNKMHGTGLEYITNKKLKQMIYSAEVWVATNNWLGDYRLGAIEMSGDNFDVDVILTDL